MMIEDLSLTDIQDFVVREVATSAEFAQFCTTTIGGQLRFYRGRDLRYGPEAESYFAAHKFYSQDASGLDPTWHIQYIIGIPSPVDGTDSVTDGDGVVILESSDKVEALALKALGIIREGIRAGGVNGICNLRVDDANVLITEVGEADDVQAIVTLRFEAYKTI